ncbi:MAG: GNAT family N-acetyltransferase [Anaerolineae bacterium]|nr:GNAT family N-acetyltransferase [Anaerolineae bacterium]
MPELRRLETKRLVLRPLQLDDGATIARLAGDWRVAWPIPTIPHPYSLGRARDFIRATRRGAAEGSEAVYAVTRKPEPALIGIISLRPQQGFIAETGYWMGVAYWGQGYMTEALRAIIRHAFCDLHLQRIFAWHIGRNPASGRVMQKAGMRHEARLRQHVLHRGEVEDQVYYGLLRDEYLDADAGC